MSNDDRTVDADPETMEELREIAAGARGKVQDAVAPAVSHDRTVDADPETMDDLRRFAAEARAKRADRSSMAPPTKSSAEPPAIVTEFPSALPHPHAGEPTVVPDPLEPPSFDEIRFESDRPSVVQSTGPDLSELTVSRASVVHPGPDVDQLSDGNGEGWQPPARMVMPTQPDKQVDGGRGPWKLVSIALGIVAAVLLGVVVFSFVADDNAPSVDSPEGPVDAPAEAPTDDDSGGG